MNIVHASIDENKKIKGGTAGDQTGKEVCVRSWYNKNWDLVLRHPNEKIANSAANIGMQLAESNLVGYDQNERNTLYKALKDCNFSLPEFLSCGKKVETDCSAFITACYITAGVKTLMYSSNAPTTSTMESVFKNAGFSVLKENKYLDSPDYLRKGDVLVKKGSHTVMCTESGIGYGNKKVYFPAYKGLATSISQALSEIGVDSSKSNRKRIYQVNFSDPYNYTAYQNTQMLNKLKQGTLIKP